MSYTWKNPPPPIEQCDTDPVGVLEIASRLGVLDRSVHMMLRRDRLPAPDYDSVNGSRAWEWRTILWWAGETRRLRSEALCIEYRAVFGHHCVHCLDAVGAPTVPHQVAEVSV